MNSSIDFIIMLLKYSIIFVKVYTCCYSICFFILASYIINFNRVASSSTSYLSSIIFVTRLFDSFSLAISLNISIFNRSIIVVKLISRLEVFYSFR